MEIRRPGGDGSREQGGGGGGHQRDQEGGGGAWFSQEVLWQTQWSNKRGRQVSHHVEHDHRGEFYFIVLIKISILQ